jgi:hypothetical protein
VERGLQIVMLIMILAMVSACSHLPPSAATTEKESVSASADQQARVPDQYLVTLAPDVDHSVIVEQYERFGIKYLRVLGGETFLLILLNDPGPQKMEALIRGDSRFKVVQPNIISWNYQ